MLNRQRGLTLAHTTTAPTTTSSAYMFNTPTSLARRDAWDDAVKAATRVVQRLAALPHLRAIAATTGAAIAATTSPRAS